MHCFVHNHHQRNSKDAQRLKNVISQLSAAPWFLLFDTGIPARRNDGDTGFLSLLWDAVLFFFALWLIFIWKALTRATLPQSPRWPAESIPTDCERWSTCVWVPGGSFDLPMPPGIHSCAASRRRDGWTSYLPNLNLILPPLVWALSWEVGNVVWIPPGWRKHWSQISHFMGQRFC